MPGNDFEKAVQQRMEELRLRPSEDVWQKVEAEIQQKKKRRSLFFLLLLAGLTVLGYMGYSYLSHQPKAAAVAGHTGHDAPAVSIDDQPSAETTSKTTVAAQAPVAMPSTGTAAARSLSSAELPAPLNGQAVLKNTDNLSAQPVPGNNRGRQLQASGTTFPASQPATRSTVVKAGSIQQGTTGLVPSLQGSPAKPEAAATSIPTEPVLADSNAAMVKTELPEDLPAEKKPLPEPAIAKSKQKKLDDRAWRFGLEAAGGMSGVKSGAFSLKQASPVENAMNAGLQISVPPPSSMIYLPSTPRSGTSFRAGVVAEKKITSRSRFSGGLQYNYMSMYHRIGHYNNNISQYNSGPPETHYAASVHFISIPVAYHWQLNKGLRWPVITWDIGFTGSRLISSNALLYSPSSGGIYYHNAEAFRKFHLDISSGFSFRFGETGRWQWSAGPMAGFDLWPLYNKDAHQPKQYLFFGGVKARVLLPRK